MELTLRPVSWPCPAMKVSKRISGLTGGGSDGWDIYRKARALKAAGADVIELTIGEHDRRTEHRPGFACDRCLERPHDRSD